MDIFAPADILLPRVPSPERWAVIACDQFTSEPEYWRRVRAYVGGAPSALRLILPEAELGERDGERAAAIRAQMDEYLAEGLFEEYKACMIYVERTLSDGRVRRGVVGAIDLEAYDYGEGSTSAVRASERTVVERIPPRVGVRRDAPLELTHVLLLCDDAKRALIEPLTEEKARLDKLYDFELMEGGGRVAGWLVRGEALDALSRRLAAYAADTPGRCAGLGGAPVLFAVGDGNHSLATAKACYEEQKRAVGPKRALALPSRWALVELQNIHDDAQTFEPIHRIVRTGAPDALLDALRARVCAESGHPVRWVSRRREGQLFLDAAKGPLAVGVLQSFLDGYAKEHPLSIDYIHGEDALRTLAAQEDAIGFLLPAIDKAGLFAGIVKDGVLPRKAFSMGNARDKRYYFEARRIR